MPNYAHSQICMLSFLASVLWIRSVTCHQCGNVIHFMSSEPKCKLLQICPIARTAVVKKKLRDQEKKIFTLMRGAKSFWQKELSHYYRENFICISQAGNFLFLFTVYRGPSNCHWAYKQKGNFLQSFFLPQTHQTKIFFKKGLYELKITT